MRKGRFLTQSVILDKVEISLLFNRAVTTTNILFKEEDQKNKRWEKGRNLQTKWIPTCAE